MKDYNLSYFLRKTETNIFWNAIFFPPLCFILNCCLPHSFSFLQSGTVTLSLGKLLSGQIWQVPWWRHTLFIVLALPGLHLSFLACGHHHTESTALQKLEDTACRRRAELTTSPEIVISLLLSQPIYKNTLLGLSLSGCFWANVSNVFNCSPVCGSGESCHAQWERPVFWYLLEHLGFQSSEPWNFYLFHQTPCYSYEESALLVICIWIVGVFISF